MEGIFDLRKRQLRHTFLAHDAPVKSIVVDENEEFFISGSEDGDIKVTANLRSGALFFEAKVKGSAGRKKLESDKKT